MVVVHLKSARSHVLPLRRKPLEARALKRLAVVAVLSIVLLLVIAGPALASSDDDVPGTPLAFGADVSQTVSAGDVNDVYSVSLTVGQEVHIRCDPGTSDEGRFHLLVAGASSLGGSENYDELIYQLSGGSFLRYWADYDYIPARSGTYYLWVEWREGTLSYDLSVRRTARAPLSMAPESDDIPGTPIGSGVVTGVVSSKSDPDDVYAVQLTAGQPATIRLIPLTPYNNGNSSLAYLSLLDPGTTSISHAYGHLIGERLMAKNSEDAASRETAEIQYTPGQTGTYYVLVEPNMFGNNFAYQLSVSGAGPPGPPGEFTDVAGSPYETAIYELADRGIILGFEDGTFRPNDPVSRQQFAKMIVRTLDLAVTGSEVCPFADVAEQVGADPFYPAKYVAVCAAHGITQGKTTTTFAPYDNILRQQLISMVTRAAALPDPPAEYEPSFAPGQFYPEEHYVNARKAAYAGLLDGLQDVGPSYDFFAASTRGECAQVLFNLLQIE